VVDGVYTSQSANLKHAIFLFKDKYTTNIGGLNLKCVLKSSKAPSESPIYLQIYNRITGFWVTVAVNNTAPADTIFTLEVNVPSIPGYYDIDYWVSCRVYQLDA